LFLEPKNCHEFFFITNSEPATGHFFCFFVPGVLVNSGECPVKKRTDPRMHSVEHILNQTIDRMFKCGRCFNAHIEKKKSKCDYHFDRPLTKNELEEIQNRVNQIIKDDLVVTENSISIAEALANYSTDKLPDNAGNTIRIVRIGDYDACPCIGQHVTSTADIGKFHITSCSFENGVLRIRFKLKLTNQP
jgi:alanyl-tRNA synthetase